MPGIPHSPEVLGHLIMKAWQNGSATGHANARAGEKAFELIGEDRTKLLAMLKELVGHPELDCAETLAIPREQFMRARALIAKIEGK
jgi:hypothetical protein